MARTTHVHTRHRGLVPTDQLADSTATTGFVPRSDGDGTTSWAGASGIAFAPAGSIAATNVQAAIEEVSAESGGGGGGGWEAAGADGTKLETGREIIYDEDELSYILLNPLGVDIVPAEGPIWLIPAGASATPAPVIVADTSSGLVLMGLSADPTVHSDGQIYYNSTTDKLRLRANGAWEDVGGGGGGGAPDDVNYLVGTASGDLSAEIVVGTTPGGELGGTWASPTVDATHSGSTHAATQAAAEATAASALSGHTGDTTDAHDASAVSYDPTSSGMTATDVQAAIDELDGAIGGGGHAEDHDHDGSPTQKLAQANTHESPDTDSATSALHHTLGTGANQAAAGDHDHGAGAWEVYTPTLLNATLGNGTLVGRRKQVDANTWAWRMHFVFGSTSSISGQLGVTLPGTAVAGSKQTCHGFIRDAGTAYFAVVGVIDATGTTVAGIVSADGAGSRLTSGTNPMTWANGDELILSGILEV